jgi:hypothetical protein
MQAGSSGVRLAVASIAAMMSGARAVVPFNCFSVPLQNERQNAGSAAPLQWGVRPATRGIA